MPRKTKKRKGRVKRKRNPVAVKNPASVAEMLEVFTMEPMAALLQPEEREYLDKVIRKLREGKELTEDDKEFIGDLMTLIMRRAGPREIGFGVVSNPPSVFRGTIRRVGDINRHNSFPVFFMGEGRDIRPVMFDQSFRDDQCVRPGKTIEFEYEVTSYGWRVVTPGSPVSRVDRELVSQDTDVQQTGEFTTGYVTVPRGEEEGEVPYRMAWGPRGGYLPGSIEEVSGLKIPEDVIDSTNEQRLSNDLPPILPSYGNIRVEGQRNGRIFEVTRILFYTSETRDQTLNVPLSELKFEENAVRFDFHGSRGLITQNIPFDSHPVLNTLRHHFDGSVIVRGDFKKEGRWDRQGEHVHWEFLGNEATWSPTSIDNLQRIYRAHEETRRIRELIDRYYREGRTIDLDDVATELSEIYGRSVTVAEVEQVLGARREDYEWEYMELLKDFARREDARYLYIPHRGKPEFVFVIRDKLIVEIPIANKASYIFHVDSVKGWEQQLTDIRAVEQRSLIYRDQAIADELKYMTRIIHRAPDTWIDRVKVAVKTLSEENQAIPVTNPAPVSPSPRRRNPDVVQVKYVPPSMGGGA